MNFLLIRRNELLSDCSARLCGERAQHALKVHGITQGLTLSCVVERLGRGKALVEALTAEQADLSLHVTEELPQSLPLTLLVAVPRPQTIKKVLQLAACCGLSAVNFVRTVNVDKSYLQSKSLEAKNIEAELIKGLEQSGDGVFPQISVSRSLSSVLQGLPPEALRLMADLGPDSSIPRRATAQSRAIVLALGPEAGWSEEERGLFMKHGFHTLSLGNRMYRVEHALALILGQIMLLRSSGSADNTA